MSKVSELGECGVRFKPVLDALPAWVLSMMPEVWSLLLALYSWSSYPLCACFLTYKTEVVEGLDEPTYAKYSEWCSA